MKKIILSLLLSATAGFASAQCEIHLEGETTDVSGTILTVAANPGSDNFAEVVIKNTSGSEKYWKIRRVRLTTPPSGWTDWVCLGLEGDPFGGTCYQSYPANPWTTPQPAGTYEDGAIVSGIADGSSAIASFHINPAEVTGSTHYRYYVLQDGGPYEDSIDVVATGTLAVKEIKDNVSISVYPNPASSNVIISATGSDDSFTVKMTDVLGKLVYSDEGVSPKKIDVSEFKNGVYIVAIIQRGVAVQTKRLVVKH